MKFQLLTLSGERNPIRPRHVFYTDCPKHTFSTWIEVAAGNQCFSWPGLPKKTYIQLGKMMQYTSYKGNGARVSVVSTLQPPKKSHFPLMFWLRGEVFQRVYVQRLHVWLGDFYRGMSASHTIPIRTNIFLYGSSMGDDWGFPLLLFYFPWCSKRIHQNIQKRSPIQV